MCGEDKMDYQLEFGFASDLMSDVLTLKNDNVLLITGLTNTQVLRTAEMSDIHCIVLARNKTVTAEMLELAKENEIAIICCKYSVFKTCGLLYEKGLQPIY
jgi:serine kinase of HPr protein (carbohydrate metabolism regulator)